MARAFAEIAFTPAVRAAQERYGSAKAGERFLSDEIDRRDTLTPHEAEFIQARDGFYLGTVSEDGWPYIQFRGGPAGFLRVLDERTIAWADFRGNRQYLSAGNLAANDRVSLFLMDYPNRRRLKLWGRAQIVEAADSPGLMTALFPEGYKAIPERVVSVTIAASTGAPTMARAFAEIAFTPAVRAAQERYGSAKAGERFLSDEIDRRDALTINEAEFIQARDGFYLGTVSEDGWPYMQFRGGPAGFLRVLDENTVAWVDFRGNRQYLSAGNLGANDRVSLFLMDYPNRRRLKLWGRAQIVEAADSPGLMTALFPEGYKAIPERVVSVTIAAFDWNCPQHIPQRLTAAEWEAMG